MTRPIIRGKAHDVYRFNSLAPARGKVYALCEFFHQDTGKQRFLGTSDVSSLNSKISFRESLKSAIYNALAQFLVYFDLVDADKVAFNYVKKNDLNDNLRKYDVKMKLIGHQIRYITPKSDSLNLNTERVTRGKNKGVVKARNIEYISHGEVVSKSPYHRINEIFLRDSLRYEDVEVSRQSNIDKDIRIDFTKKEQLRETKQSMKR